MLDKLELKIKLFLYFGFISLNKFLRCFMYWIGMMVTILNQCVYVK